jgi:glycerol-3-phosphate acyltransferase PlsY
MSLTNHPILTAALTVLGAYLVGSISFAVIFSKLFVKKDVRNFGSGNAGMTNVMRVAGALPGLLTFIFDMAKGFASAYFGRIVFSNLYEATENQIYSPLLGSMICAFVCLLGHVFPVFFRFRGGKGVATAAGAAMGIMPFVAVILLLIFVFITALTKTVSLASGICAVVYPLLAYFICNSNQKMNFLFAAACSVLIIVLHGSNFARLIDGKEKPISSR